MKLEEKINEVKSNLVKYAQDNDYEGAHVSADNEICEFLRFLGYKEIVDLYEEVGKWYS